MSDSKHIDVLVKKYLDLLKQADERGKCIEDQAKPTVVLFIDLADSTAMKSRTSPRSWLGHIFTFISVISELAEKGGGTVVKRIGDEVMLTFDTTASSEQFLDSLAESKLHEHFHFKIAADYGKAYHFQFEKGLPDDPYGPVVDRCARVAKYAGVGTVICTADYRNQLGNPADCVSMGGFTLRGFPKPEELFARSLVHTDSEEYLKPFLSAVNKEAPRVQGYRFVGRKLTTEFVRGFGDAKVRPFLARELLNVPKLPYSPEEFNTITGGTGNLTEKEHEFFGYFVEWEGTVESFTRDSFEIVLRLKIGSFPSYYGLSLRLPLSYLELVKLLKMGQRLRARGIIDDIHLGIVTLNYVDLESVTESGGA